jgi:hypothetical protein
MTSSVVTNIEDLSDAMLDLLMRPEGHGSMAKATAVERRSFDALRGKGLLTDLGNRWYRLTEAGVRCRKARERKNAPTVVVQSLGSYGWSMVSEIDFGAHAITTWTSSEHSLVLSWTGSCEVSAAILDGAPLPLDKLIETVTTVYQDDEPVGHLLAMASRKAPNVANHHHAIELSGLLNELATSLRSGAHMSQPIHTAANNLAAAILATPHAR